MKFEIQAVVVTCIWSTFDLLVSKVILGPFSECTCLKWLVTRKRLAIELNALKFGTEGYVLYAYGVSFVVEDHLRLFSALVSKWPVTRKRRAIEGKLSG